MIVDLRVRNRAAVVIGGGREALKRTKALLAGGGIVHVVGERLDGGLDELARSGAITADAVRIRSAAGVIAERAPMIVVAATDDAGLNSRVLSEARSAGCLAYASDDPGASDFANLSVISIGGGGGRGSVHVAVSTEGASPAAARDVRSRIEPLVRSAITEADLAAVGLHARLRPLIAERLAGGAQAARRAALARISADPLLKQLLEHGRDADAWRRAEGMLDAICDEAGPGQR